MGWALVAIMLNSKVVLNVAVCFSEQGRYILHPDNVDSFGRVDIKSM